MGDLQRVNPDEGKERKRHLEETHYGSKRPGWGDGRRVDHMSLLNSPALHLNDWAAVCHDASVAGGWWHDTATGDWKDRNIGEMFMLMVTELAEAFEGIRKDKKDDHIPSRPSEEVELADLMIRLFDYAGSKNLDLDGAIRDKMNFNRDRADHKLENRLKEGGKKW